MCLRRDKSSFRLIIWRGEWILISSSLSNEPSFFVSVLIEHVLVFLAVADGFVNRLDRHVVILCDLLRSPGFRLKSLVIQNFRADSSILDKILPVA
jgi:hypothetical protein